MGILTAFPGSHLGITMGFLVNLRLLCLRAQMAMLGRMAVLTILDRSCRSVGSQAGGTPRCHGPGLFSGASLFRHDLQ